MFDETNLASGHYAPYFTMGGDRNNDDHLAAVDENMGTDIDDGHDKLTVYHANYRSNIALQHQNGFNGSAGIWNKVETWVRKSVDEGDRELWVIAGSVFGEGEPETAGPNDLVVPPAFFKIVILEQVANDPPVVLAFLLPHHRTAHGRIHDFLVSVDVLEALTGLDFFSDMTVAEQRELERVDTFENWKALFGDG